jgi:glycine cleavage system H lipoate-binding protein/ABC-type phosphate transport system substrate-binding protein
MKRIIFLLISIILLNISNISISCSLNESNNNKIDSVKLLSSPDLFNLSNKWASEFNKVNPDIRISVEIVTTSKNPENLFANATIGFVSNEYVSDLSKESIMNIVIGRDIIVPVINSKNPYLDEISKKGISAEKLARFFNDPDSRSWGALLDDKQNAKANYYCTNDESVLSGLKEFLNTNRLTDIGTEVKTGNEMISAIQKDPYAIGFCKMVNIYDFENQSIAENIKLMPIDRNGNNVIDYNENIYDDFNGFSRGVWIGKYPKSLFSNIYSVYSDKSKNENELLFLKWILSDGQQFLYTSGYTDLLVSERQSTIDKLNNAEVFTSSVMEEKSIFRPLLFILVIFVLAILIFDNAIRYLKNRKNKETSAGSEIPAIIDANSMLIPQGLYFDKTHTWAFMDQNGIVKVGIDDFLQHITGAITRIETKTPGEKIKKGDIILSIIQKGKQLHLYSPVSGVIKKNNEKLNTNTLLINSSPYNEGWVYEIEPSNWMRENQLLFMAQKQKEFIKNEFTRLKDFLATTLKVNSQESYQVILQDGGELKDGILSTLGPKVWEDFQTNFIDPSRQVWFYEMF